MPYWKEDLSEKPLIERRKKLEEFYKKYLSKSNNFALTHFNLVSSKEELAKIAKKMASIPMSEGIVVKVADSPYPEGGTNYWSKLKHVVELKVIVLDKQVNKNNTFSYYCGVLPGNLKIKNIRKFKGQDYVDLGKTMSTKIDANIGDILTVQVEEIIVKEEDDGIKLQWVIPRVIDIDKERSKPYYAGQVIDLAERGHILQKSVKDEGEPTRADIALEFWENNWWKLFPKSGKGRFVYQFHFRGLSEKEAKEMNLSDLIKTDHSVHGDLRLQRDSESLFGFSVFEGDTCLLYTSPSPRD